MKKRIAINGFGRIGRLTFRNLWEMNDVEIVAINDLTNNKTLAHLLKYDSAHGIFNHKISSSDQHITINGSKVNAFSERDPGQLPWKELDVDVVLECTGVFRTKDGAIKHIEAGAKKVILSAPAKDDNFETIVLGINDELIRDDKVLYSNASCTTNCLAPVVKVLHDNFGFAEGTMTTIHAYTADQRIQDAPHRDLRRARAAAVNMIPTSTGAGIAVEKVIPAIAGRLTAGAVRVPVLTGSLIDLTCQLEKTVSAEEINAAFLAAANGPMEGIIEYSTAPLVSSDIVGHKASSIFDSALTDVGNNLVRLVSWYDNEAGYSARLADLALKV